MSKLPIPSGVVPLPRCPGRSKQAVPRSGRGAAAGITYRETESGELDDLKPGDRVRSKAYTGDGEIISANEFWIWIQWDRYGFLDHQPSFAQHLERVDPCG